MNQICVSVPAIRAGHTIGLTVTIDGKQHVMNYRVESVPWAEWKSLGQRIDVLRDFIGEYDEGWELVQIGPPANGLVPVTFRQQVTEPAGERGKTV